jgi:hypothetical protein
LDIGFYRQKLLPLLAQRLVVSLCSIMILPLKFFFFFEGTHLWISVQKKSNSLPDDLIYKYLVSHPDETQQSFNGLDKVDDESMKILNLSQQLLHSVLPFIWGKISKQRLKIKLLLIIKRKNQSGIIWTPIS